MVLLGAFTVITALSWVMRPPGDAFIAYLYPVFCAILVAFLIGLWRYPAALPRLEMAMFAFGMAAVLARLAWHLYGPADIEAQLLPLVGGHYWSIGVLIIAAFFVFERHAVLVGGAVLIVPGHGFETARCAGYAAILTPLAASGSRAFCMALI